MDWEQWKCTNLWWLQIWTDGCNCGQCLKAGGEVTGVEPNFFIENEFQHDGLTKLIVTKDMTERKNKMIELSEAFIAFPGGTGTLEEIAEVMSKVSLKHLDASGCTLHSLQPERLLR